MLDENLSWKNHIDLIENKIAKSIGLLYKARKFLNLSNLKTLYFSYIHTYLNYANIAWGSTQQTKLKKLHNRQKHAARIVFRENRYTHAQPLLKALSALNIFQINIFQILLFMYKVQKNTSPPIFQNTFKKPQHKYPTQHSISNFSVPKTKLNLSKFSISRRGPMLWNSFLSISEKEMNTFLLFRKTVKERLLQDETCVRYFH